MKPSPGGRLFYSMLILGGGVIAFGLAGLVADADDTHPIDFVGWFLGGLLVHDLIVAPAAFAVALLIVTRTPPLYRAAVQGGSFATAVLVGISYPLVRGFGRSPSNPSALPNDYGKNLLLAIALVWLVALGAAVRARFRR